MSWYFNTKKICDKCKKEYMVEVNTLEKSKKDNGECPFCNKNEFGKEQKTITIKTDNL